MNIYSIYTILSSQSHILNLPLKKCKNEWCLKFQKKDFKKSRSVSKQENLTHVHLEVYALRSGDTAQKMGHLTKITRGSRRKNCRGFPREKKTTRLTRKLTVWRLAAGGGKTTEAAAICRDLPLPPAAPLPPVASNAPSLVYIALSHRPSRDGLELNKQQLLKQRFSTFF